MSFGICSYWDMCDFVFSKVVHFLPRILSSIQLLTGCLGPESGGGWGSHRLAAALYSFSVFIFTSQTLVPMDLLTQVKSLLIDFSRKSISGLQKWWERKVIFMPRVEKGAPWTAQTPMCLICHVHTEVFFLNPHTVYWCYFLTVNINFIMILPSQYVPPNLHLINLFPPQ